MFRLTKTSYLQGRQCPLRLWLRAHDIDEAPIDYSEDPADDFQDEAEAVEELAETIFPGGVRISSDADLSSRTNLTSSLMRDESVPALFQAAFATKVLKGFTDILVRSENGWILYEVKASSSVKPLFIYDLAFQWNLLNECGYQVIEARVLHLNTEYLHDIGTWRAHEVLVDQDCTSHVLQVLDEVRNETREFTALVGQEQAPEVNPSRHCKGNSHSKKARFPSDCGHLEPSGMCGQKLPENWVFQLPRLAGAEKQEYLAQCGSQRIEDLDPDDPATNWTELQRRVIQAVNSGRPHVEHGLLTRKLEAVSWPVAYIDFEFEPAVALPRFSGMRPNQKLPFQWAMSVQHGPEEPLVPKPHFLHESDSDPRREFVESLLDQLPASGSVVVHSRTAESSILKLYEQWFEGKYAVSCVSIINRMFDTCELSRDTYYHPDLKGSFSIKALGPTILKRGYEHLKIQNGMEAVRQWRRLIAADTPSDVRQSIRRNLLEYCQQDAHLMHDLLVAFRRFAAEGAC